MSMPTAEKILAQVLDRDWWIRKDLSRPVPQFNRKDLEECMERAAEHLVRARGDRITRTAIAKAWDELLRTAEGQRWYEAHRRAEPGPLPVSKAGERGPALPTHVREAAEGLRKGNPKLSLAQAVDRVYRLHPDWYDPSA